MAQIVGNKPRMQCNCCKCTFEYDASDIHETSEQVWGGFGTGWEFVRVRYVTCPGCDKHIRL